MNKEDLKTGMLVELRDRDILKVFKDTVCGGLLISEDNRIEPLNEYTRDFMRKGFYDQYDIVKIYSNDSNGCEYRIKDYDMRGYDLIWELEDIKELTKDEIEEILGYKIKIV